jgi:Ca2+-binding EF-hand superfamily protein
MNKNELHILFTSRGCYPLDLKCDKMIEDFKRKNYSYLNLHVFSTFMEYLMEINKKEEDVEQQVLAGHSTESWKDRSFLLAYSSPL